MTTTTYQQAVKFIHALPSFSSKPSLERIRKLLILLDNPQDKLNYIHVAGTNGKGSITTMCANILKHAGYKVGLYISPFIIDFRERFQINGEMIGQDEFLSVFDKIKHAYDLLIASGFELNQYDFITAFSFEYFHQNHCDIVCLEVGLGGLFDATNIIASPEVAVITKISYDHMAVLGNTIEQISHEKAGIIKGGAVVSYPEQEDDALAVIMEQCAQTRSSLILPHMAGIELEQSDCSGSSFVYCGEHYRINMMGEHQVHNAVTAIETINQLTGFKASQQEIQEGLACTRFPARLELLSEKPFVILDGAHNENGVAALADMIQKLECTPKIGVGGMLADKDCVAEFKLLSGVIDHLILTTVPSARAQSPDKLFETAQNNGYTVALEPDPIYAYRQAVHLAGEQGGVVVFGSLYLASHLRKIILENGQ